MLWVRALHRRPPPRRLYLCNGWRRQTSLTPLTAATILASTKVRLTTWFRAMYLIPQAKQGISSIELGRRLGTTQTTAREIKTIVMPGATVVTDGPACFRELADAGCVHVALPTG